MDKEIIAVFDFDGTLTVGRPSRSMFIKQLVSRARYAQSLLLQPFLFGLRQLRFIDKQQEASYFDRLFLAGLDKEKLSSQADIFISQVLIGQLRQEAIARLRYHQQQGHVCIVVSGAWDIYLKPWADQYGINHVLCTELEFDPLTNKSTGRMSKQYCLGSEKLQRFKNLYAKREEYVLYAYGDSEQDRELLAYADYAFYRRFQ